MATVDEIFDSVLGRATPASTPSGPTPGLEAVTTPSGAVTGDPRLLRRRPPGEVAPFKTAASRLAVEGLPVAGAVGGGLLGAPFAGVSPAIPAGLAMGGYVLGRGLQAPAAEALGVPAPPPPAFPEVGLEAAMGELGARLGVRGQQGTSRAVGGLLGRRLAQRTAAEGLESAQQAAATAGLASRDVGLTGRAQVAEARRSAAEARLDRLREGQAARSLDLATRGAEQQARAAEQAATAASGQVATSQAGLAEAERAATRAERGLAEATAAPARAQQALEGAGVRADRAFEAVTGQPAVSARQFDLRVQKRLDVRADAARHLKAFRQQAETAFEKVRVLAGDRPIVQPTRFDDTIRRLRQEAGTPAGAPPFATRTNLGEASPIDAVGGVPINPSDPYQATLLEAINRALGETTGRGLTFAQAHRIQAQLREMAFGGAAPIGTLRRGEAALAYRAIRDDLAAFLETPGQGPTAQALNAAKQQYRLGKSPINGRMRALFKDQPEAVLDEVFRPDAGELLLDFKALIGEEGYRAAQTAWLARLRQQAQVVSPTGARLTDPRRLLTALEPYEASGALDAILSPEQSAVIKGLMTDLARVGDQAALALTTKGAAQRATAEATLLERQAQVAQRRAVVERRKTEAITEQTRATERRLEAQRASAASTAAGARLDAIQQRAQAATDRLRQVRETAEANARRAAAEALQADQALHAAKTHAAALGVKTHGGLTAKEMGWFLGRASAASGLSMITLGLDPYTAGVLGATFGAAGGRLGARIERTIVTPQMVRALTAGKLPGLSDEAVLEAARLLGYSAAAGRIEGRR